jgi:hypothetical protein
VVGALGHLFGFSTAQILEDPTCRRSYCSNCPRPQFPSLTCQGPFAPVGTSNKPLISQGKTPDVSSRLRLIVAFQIPNNHHQVYCSLLRSRRPTIILRPVYSSRHSANISQRSKQFSLQIVAQCRSETPLPDGLVPSYRMRTCGPMPRIRRIRALNASTPSVPRPLQP